MDWAVVIASLPLMMRGLITSLQLTMIATALSFPLGCLIAVGRLSHRRWLSGVCTAFVNILRSNPLILILFWFYFLVPLVTGQNVDDLTSIIVAFVVFFAAYFAEIVRAGVQSVGVRQIQVGLSSGLTYAQTMLYIVIPQAVRAMLPALITQVIVVFQGTTVVYVIGYSELLHTTTQIAERTVRPVEMYVTSAVIYFFVCFTASQFARRFERSLR